MYFISIFFFFLFCNIYIYVYIHICIYYAKFDEKSYATLVIKIQSYRKRIHVAKPKLFNLESLLN